VLSPPQPHARFALLDQNGARYVLGAPGSVSALYFGFTHCKDICPQTLAMLGKARSEAALPPPRMRIVMVTVDPKRDTAAAMRAFFAKVGVQAIGLTGAPSELRRVYRSYGVGIVADDRDPVHTAYVYLLDASGRTQEILSSQTPVSAIAQDMRALAP
jgi:protein SCO1/2